MGSEVIVVPIVMALVAFITYLYFNTRHKERMALIETGKDAGLFKDSQDPHFMGALKWGLLLVCLGVGAGIGIYIDVLYDNDGPLATFPLLFGSGGIGLLIYYTIVKNQREDD